MPYKTQTGAALAFVTERAVREILERVVACDGDIRDDATARLSGAERRRIFT